MTQTTDCKETTESEWWNLQWLVSVLHWKTNKMKLMNTTFCTEPSHFNRWKLETKKKKCHISWSSGSLPAFLDLRRGRDMSFFWVHDILSLSSTGGRSIQILYLSKSTNTTVWEILHYKYTKPVLKILLRYRSFISRMCFEYLKKKYCSKMPPVTDILSNLTLLVC